MVCYWEAVDAVRRGWAFLPAPDRWTADLLHSAKVHTAGEQFQHGCICLLYLLQLITTSITAFIPKKRNDETKQDAKNSWEFYLFDMNILQIEPFRSLFSLLYWMFDGSDMEDQETTSSSDNRYLRRRKTKKVRKPHNSRTLMNINKRKSIHRMHRSHWFGHVCRIGEDRNISYRIAIPLC